MKVFLYLLPVFAIWYLYILVRFIMLRIRLFFEIKHFAKENNIEYKITTPAFLIPSNRHGTAVILKTEKSTYNIRLFGLLRKNCAVHFWNKEMYSVEKFIPRMILVNETPLGHTNVKRRNLGKWNINADTEIPVLLYSPANSPIRITKTQVNHIERLIAGDMIEDVLFADSDFLFRYISNRL